MGPSTHILRVHIILHFGKEETDVSKLHWSGTSDVEEEC